MFPKYIFCFNVSRKDAQASLYNLLSESPEIRTSEKNNNSHTYTRARISTRIHMGAIFCASLAPRAILSAIGFRKGG